MKILFLHADIYWNALLVIDRPHVLKPEEKFLSICDSNSASKNTDTGAHAVWLKGKKEIVFCKHPEGEYLGFFKTQENTG